MMSIRRSSSASSCSSIITTSSLTSLSSRITLSETHIRRRISPSQQQALKSMFLLKSHPSKEERQALANEIGMELKAVTVWFQNKRQTTKKRAGKENERPKNTVGGPIPPDYLAELFPTHPLSIRPLCATISLDQIAKLNERHSQSPSACRTSGPTVPRTVNARKLASSDIDKLELWKHMPSSPIAPPASPSVDSARLSILPMQSKVMRSLEWACAKARVSSSGYEDEDDDYFRRSDRDNEPLNGGDGSETDMDIEEAVTPDSSTHISRVTTSSDFKAGDTLERWRSQQPPDEVALGDVEAAMLLLGFMGRR